MKTGGVQPPRVALGNHTLELDDERLTIEVDSNAAATVTVPAHADVEFPVGAQVDIVQAGPGQVTVAAATGVTINAFDTLVLAGRWAAATLYQRALDEWVLIGNVETA